MSASNGTSPPQRRRRRSAPQAELLPEPTRKPQKRPRVFLRNAQDVRRFLGRLANEVYMGELRCKRLNSITAACNIILRSLEVGDLTERVKKLEEQSNAKS